MNTKRPIALKPIRKNIKHLYYDLIALDEVMKLFYPYKVEKSSEIPKLKKVLRSGVHVFSPRPGKLVLRINKIVEHLDGNIGSLQMLNSEDGRTPATELERRWGKDGYRWWLSNAHWISQLYNYYQEEKKNIKVYNANIIATLPMGVITGKFGEFLDSAEQKNPSPAAISKFQDAVSQTKDYIKSYLAIGKQLHYLMKKIKD